MSDREYLIEESDKETIEDKIEENTESTDSEIDILENDDEKLDINKQPW